ncbi:MAG: non-canonical purine NTP pyrophosphatase, RdgB/HAM1 family [Actinobacteria bacterium RBG_19FT_COMBO_54_7]|uniref:dITP/XTP pyrophosphatase n=1 Tax=Candidatus Solincola sediminis TaxID=1797199 RepID=A0A1F2WPF8_9ACTN|nr:MAG: non-canonical purine NTP pyrophosphatase, RdgB/HAM1 family [Candidatus Solincola sediminis]OFW67948.1 MAG: non-canonical purine NTP pyrophosphatase, RdgB/HAM1 family [Actinobacteria bacterium RBG_19FT_COMBO_54_7]
MHNERRNNAGALRGPLNRARIVLATLNRGKVLEIERLLSGLAVELLTREDFETWPDMEETGATFEENARQKACTLADWSRVAALADDSGLEVDALGGRPGVRSSRYAGEEGDSQANMALLFDELKEIPDDKRQARFVCVISLCSPDGKRLEIRETCEGRITTEQRGASGFGYDPVFVPEGMDRTMAQLSLEEKNAISHRGKALRRLRSLLEKGEPAWLFV